MPPHSRHHPRRQDDAFYDLQGWECLACGSTTSTTAEGQIDEVEHYTDLVTQHLKAGTEEDLNEAQGWARALIEEAQLLKEALDVMVQKTRKALTKRPKTKPQRFLRIRSQR